MQIITTVGPVLRSLRMWIVLAIFAASMSAAPRILLDDHVVTEQKTQTLTNKTLTDPTINAEGGVVVAPTTASPAQTAEGSMVWDSDDDRLTIGTGAGRKTLVDTGSTLLLPAPSTAGRIIYDSGSAWTVLAAGSSGQLLQSGGGGAPSWAWPVDYRHLYTNAITNNNYFGQATTATAQPRDARAARVFGAGTINYVVLTAIGITTGGAITVQLYKSTDGCYTYSAIGTARTLTTTIQNSQSDSSAQSDISVADGDCILARPSGYSGAIFSLSVVIRSGGGARLA